MNVPPPVPQRSTYHSLGRRRIRGRCKIGVLEVALTLERGASGRIEVARSTDQVGDSFSQRQDGFLSGVARRHRAVRGSESRKRRIPSFRQFTGEHLTKLVSQLRIGS